MAEDVNDDLPDSLRSQCMAFVVDHLETFAEEIEDDAYGDLYRLCDGVSLPGEICDSLLKTCSQQGYVFDDKFLHIFKDTSRTRLHRISLRDSIYITDTSIGWLMPHHPVELDISGCSALTGETINFINKYGKNLRGLFLGDCTRLFDQMRQESMEVDGEDTGPLFNCPQLRAFSLRNVHETESLERPAHDTIARCLMSFQHLNFLDLSGCDVEQEFMDCFEHLSSLTKLMLYNVPIGNIYAAVNAIGKLKNLRVLDIAQGREESPVMYSEPEKNLRNLVASLPYLMHLDISGTNLAGFQRKPSRSHKPKAGDTRDVSEEEEDGIPGLEGRHLEFLGLLGCPYDACNREKLCADRVTGDANEDQVILAVQSYMTDRPELLVKSLNLLFNIFRYSICHRQQVALQAILAAMKKLPNDKHVQISGSASLFYIVKGEEKNNFTVRTRQRVITAILDGMEKHMEETVMMRNGCLTLCHFTIPQDVMFEYERMVTILLKMVAPPDPPNHTQEEFVQRIGIYLLNSLACQVDGQEKQLVGDLGAISTMLRIIQFKLEVGTCDEILEIAWSTMWNVTDETPLNCERFIDGDGMDYFLQCLEVFPDRQELLRNMMGLMGNVAEVQYLRPRLMQKEYVSVFSDLLDSQSDGIEVSYNSCGILSNLISDGAQAWGLEEPSRNNVLHRMVCAITRWKIRTKRNINYRSFVPILRLVPNYDVPQAQHWAIWALCNLCTMYPSKYCPLVHKEKGVGLLENVVGHPRPYTAIKDLAYQVLRLVKAYQEDPDSVQPADPEEDGEND